MAAQLMDGAPPNVPSNGRRSQERAPPLKSTRSGSFKGLFGFNKSEPLQLPATVGNPQPEVGRQALEPFTRFWLLGLSLQIVRVASKGSSAFCISALGMTTSS